MIYDWIATNFPWAGAREYSTIPNIPEYVVENRHGDCGQVALLYITLVRCLGIPARWESGFMLHPGAENYHDWAETYFEGTGWVATDPSFGRSTTGESLADYYKTGIDLYRFVVNKGVNGSFDPKKNYIRSETVDNQAGEVEWKMEILNIKTGLPTFMLIHASRLTLTVPNIPGHSPNYPWLQCAQAETMQPKWQHNQ